VEFAMAVSINSGGAALAPGLSPSSTAWLSSGVAMLVSLVIHTAALIVFALVTLSGVQSTDSSSLGDGEALAEVAIGTLAVERLTEQPVDQLEECMFGASAGRDAETLDTTVEVFADVRGPVANEFTIDDLAGPLAASGGAREAAAFGDLGTTSIAVGGGGKFDSQAAFMGVQAVGDRFCIVADRSGSMFGSKFDFLKAQVLRTVSTMSPSARLQLVFFSERSLPYPKTEWLQPAKERLAIETWLAGIDADGDTYPRGALNQAFAFDPPPDVIFFMTDGQFDPQTIYHLRRLQRVAQHKVKIHTITFVDRSSEGMMRMIATENGGTYRHVDEFGDLDR
jgi:hypothetical protein